MTKRKPNGSANLLADAMRRVVAESVEGAVEPLRKDIKELKKDVGDVRETMATKEDVANLRTDMDERFKRVETDMQNGFAELRPSE